MTAKSSLPRLRLKAGKEKSLMRRHPWIFSGAVERVTGDPQPGATVLVEDTHGQALALAAYSPQAQIRARVWTWNPQETVDAAFLAGRIQAAAQRRAALLNSGQTDAVRQAHGESDGLPGIIIDRYGEGVSVQLLSAGAEAWRVEIAAGLKALPGIRWGMERSEADVRTLEGLQPVSAPLFGDPPEQVTIHEHGLAYGVTVGGGQKTGAYLDQRANRLIVRGLCKDAEVLDAFCYTGGFTMNALAGGAQSVCAVDSSAEALAALGDNLARNSLPAATVERIDGNAFQVLRTLRDAGRSFDVVVLDPPKFAPTRQQAERAARGYKDINLLGFKLVRPGGRLVTFSCSGGVEEAFFQKIVFDAALDAGVTARLLQRLGQAEDHAIDMAFPEGTYLKGFVIAVER